MTSVQAWRRLADTFHSLPQLVDYKKLPVDYGPEEAIQIYKNTPLSRAERALLGFLLHVWNRYDFPFELSDIALWDSRHRTAFLNWVNGKTLGEPCRYF